MKQKLVILISGRGWNMRALINACKPPGFPAEVAVVISNKIDAPGIGIAQEHDIPTHVVSHKDFASKAEFETALTNIINQYDADLVCLAGFMRVLGPTYFERITVPTLNVHPSLLPKYKGLNTHDAVLAAGDAEHGCTVHIVTPELDDGEIIVQRTIPVLPDDTADTLAMRLTVEEHIAYPEAVRIMAAKCVS